MSAPTPDPKRDPMAQIREWIKTAEATEPNDPGAMALATVDGSGLPNVRMVLLKEVLDENDPEAPGFVFYTNYGSAKGQELMANPQAALVIHWKSLRVQIRARGSVIQFDDARADRYYQSRSYQSRIGAWASEQSRVLSSRSSLMAKVAKLTAQYPIDPPRPPFWGGFCLQPIEIELWADGAFRLHDRFQWRRASIHSMDWKVTRLSP